MADNVTFQTTTLATLPNATVVATDDIAGVEYQKVKLVDGTADSTTMILSGNGLAAGALRVTLASDSTGVIGVTGTFWQATQPVSGPLTDTQLRATAVPVSGTFWQTTQPISAAALPLPSGAATAAKQPALGTAGSAATDVITVQGIASGTAQPVSGTFWQATQPVSGPLTDTQLRASAVPATVTNATAANLKVEAVGTNADDAVNVSTKQAVLPAVATTSAPTYTTGRLNPLSLQTDGSLRVAVTAGGGGGSQYAEDAPHVSGDLGNIALAVRTDVPVQRAGTDADYSVLETDADGKLWVNAGTIRARKLVVNTTITASTSETTIIAAVASESHDLYGLILTNSGASSTKVTIRDDTAGTVKMVFWVPSLGTVGYTVGVGDATPQTAQNKNWTATCSASTSSLDVTALYLKVT